MDNNSIKLLIGDLNKNIKPDKIGKRFNFYRNFVIDKTNGLMWSINANLFGSKLSWKQAEDRIKKLNYGGYKDWRIPTEEEFISFIETDATIKNEPCKLLDNIGFYDVMASNYWVEKNNKYNHVNLSFGKICFGVPACYVWPVRDVKTDEQRNHEKKIKITIERQECIRLKQIDRELRAERKKEKIGLDKLAQEIKEELLAKQKETLLFEKLEQARKAKKSILLKNLNEIRRNNFIGVNSFYNENCTEYVTEREYQQGNIAFIKGWILNNIPPGIDGKIHEPDDEQAIAIGEVNTHTQVIARAGSGKTATIVNRACFLQKHCGVAPDEMMLLAFNKKAAYEMAERLDKSLDGQIPHTMTFHALAYAIVHPEDKTIYDNSTNNHMDLSYVVQDIINSHLCQPEFEVLIRDIMLAHFRQDWERTLHGGLNLGKDEMLKMRRAMPRESLNGDFLKSFGEKVIADFLFEHNVTYLYEKNHYWGNINYRPDFTVFKTDKTGIIIEYFGLNGDDDYDEMSEQKRTYWKKEDGWQLLEYIPSDITSAGVDSFIKKLKMDLELCGIPCIQLSEDEIWDRLKKRSINRFTTVVKNFISKCRQRLLTPDELCRLIGEHNVLFESEKLFNDLALLFYKVYLERIEATGEDDFDGLIQQATMKIEAGNTTFDQKTRSGDLNNLKFVFIDEFQDFSELFWRLVDAMHKQNPNIKFFCVGDDWQAINGFAGSDLKYFLHFKNYFKNHNLKYLSTNYRSSQRIVNIGNALMLGSGNPAQANKKSTGDVIYADLSEFNPALTERQRHPYDKITPAVTRLVSKALNDGSSVVMLSRTNRILFSLSDVNIKERSKNSFDNILASVRSYFPKALQDRISISTIHQYKGLEKQTVIILDAISGRYPLINSDWVFTRILGDDLEKIIKEDRRLFYVAMTRAIDKLIIMTDKDKPAPFVDDIKTQLSRILWDDYQPPPALGKSGIVIVKVVSQSGRGSSPTYSRRDLLKACGYAWNCDGRKDWAKTFPAHNFDIEQVKREQWGMNADGIEVRLHDEQQVERIKYHVNHGQWIEKKGS